MLKYEFEIDLLEALEKSLQNTDAIAPYVFNVIEPVIEKHFAKQSVRLTAFGAWLFGWFTGALAGAGILYYFIGGK